MVRNRGRKLLSAIILTICILVIQICALADETVRVGKANKTIYSVLFVEEVYEDFSENSYRAGNEYKNAKIALIGKVESIARNGKNFEIKSPSDTMKFILSGANKDNRAIIAELSKGDDIVVCGKVIKATEEKFEVSISRIDRLDTNINRYKGGLILSDGTLYASSAFSREATTSYVFCIGKEWNAEPKTLFRDDDGIQYSFINGETLTIYEVSWEEARAKDEDKNNGGKRRRFFIAERTEDYLTAEIVPHRMIYKRTTDQSDYSDYDYYYGHNRIDPTDSRYRQAEIYYHLEGDRLIIVAYCYGQKAENYRDITFLIGTLQTK